MNPKISLILHNIRSAHNVGSLFRTADGAGVAHIYLTGYTPQPPDGSQLFTTKVERKVIKVALGAHEYVPWSHHENIEALLVQLKQEQVQIIGLEQDEQSVNYSECVLERDCAIILGNEPTGIEPEILEQCDVIVEIPMHGRKKSLNVSVAGGIALYALRDTLKTD